MEQSLKLLSLLADGGFHSGQLLGEHMGITRAGVWQHLKRLQKLGVVLDAVPGRGYRLREPLELLVADRIREAITGASRLLLQELTVLPTVDSTSQWVHQQARNGLPSGSVCFAEHQSAGRGRRGRIWVSPLGRNLYFSLLWDFSLELAELGGLSLAVGVAMAEALHGLGAEGVGLKWPNDLLLAGRKLGGILLEVTGEGGGQTRAVIGIGLNFHMGRETHIDQPWTDLTEGLAESVGRNHLAGALLDELLPVLVAFQAQGFGAFRDRWKALDAIRGRPVVVHTPQRDVVGTAMGVDESGALLVMSEGRTERCYGGEVTLRMVAP